MKVQGPALVTGASHGLGRAVSEWAWRGHPLGEALLAAADSTSHATPIRTGLATLKP